MAKTGMASKDRIGFSGHFRKKSSEGA